MKKILQTSYYSIICLISLFFIYKAISNAILYSGDLWILTRFSNLLFEGKNIFEAHNLINNEIGYSIYLHPLYIIFYPLSIFNDLTQKILLIIISLTSSFLIIFYLKKIFNLDLNKTSLLSLIFFSSTPFTNTFGNGQTGLIILLGFLIFWFKLSRFSNLFLLTLGFKISFSAFFVAFLFFKKFKTFIIFSLLYLLSVIICIYILKIFNFYDILNLVISPITATLAMEKVVIFEGHFNLKYFFKIFNIDDYYFPITIVLFVIGLFSSNYIKNEKIIFIYFCNLSLIIFYHWIYDFVFLIPFFAYLLSLKKELKFIHYFNLATILFIFYFLRINQLIFNNFFDEKIINILGIIMLSFSTISLFFEKKNN